MITKLIDTHFHLDYYRNHKQVYDLINHLEQYTICMTNSPGVYVSCRKLYQETEYIKFALGFHPREKSLSTKDFSDFITLANQANYIGEVGMDFSSDSYIPKMQQINYFEKIVEICARKNTIMSVHLRKSESEAIEIIRKYSPKKCIIHWFTGSTSQLNKLIALDCYFSINANMIKNKSSNKKILQIPRDRILVESDGPFTKVNGAKYSPEYLKEEYSMIKDYFNSINFDDEILANFNSLLKL